MLKRLFRQRRRIGTGLVFFSIALIFISLENPFFAFLVEYRFGGSLLAAGGLFGVLFLTMAFAAFCAIILFAPKGRRSIEVLTASFALFEGLRLIARMGDVPPLPDATEYLPFLAIYTLLSTVLERDLPGRFGLRLRYRATHAVTLPVSPEAVWSAVAPAQDTQGTHWTRSLARVTARPDLGPNWVEAHFRVGPQGFIIQRQQRLVWQPFHHLTYAFEPEGACSADGHDSWARGVLDARIEHLPNGHSRLTLTHEYPALPFGDWSRMVLDEVVPGEVDAIAARVTGQRDWSLQGRIADYMAAQA